MSGLPRSPPAGGALLALVPGGRRGRRAEAALISNRIILSHMMALKRVRFAIEEEDCERCSQLGRKLKEQGRTLDTVLRQQG